MNDSTNQTTQPLATSRNILVVGAVVAALGIAVAGISLFDRVGDDRVENTLSQPTNAAVEPKSTRRVDFGLAKVAGAQAYSYQGVAGQTALELLKQNYNVETTKYSSGEMITSINGVAAGKDEFWALYIDGKMSQVGAGEYVATGNETIKWRLEKTQ